jgi:hypothetical protein
MKSRSSIGGASTPLTAFALLFVARVDPVPAGQRASIAAPPPSATAARRFGSRAPRCSRTCATALRRSSPTTRRATAPTTIVTAASTTGPPRRSREYEAVMVKKPNRYRAIAGAMMAAQRAGECDEGARAGWPARDAWPGRRHAAAKSAGRPPDRRRLRRLPSPDVVAQVLRFPEWERVNLGR